MTNEFPNDPVYEEWIIDEVFPGDEGWSISGTGLGFFVPKDSPVTPAVGMTARLYTKGLGHRVRGLFLDGHKVYFRTETEDREKADIDLYGADAADWLARWDSDKSVWSISMGGLGPGYEQCIHVSAAEILRWLLANKPDASAWGNDDGSYRAAMDTMEKAVFKIHAVKILGLSGAQWGAAMNLAAQLYIHGPRHIMGLKELQDRKIRVSRSFPGMTRIAETEAASV